MHSHSSNRTGSVLITAIIFGFALFAAVASYVYLTTQSMKMANRTFHLNSAMNLAEAGIEEGLYALNKFQGMSADPKDYTAWDNWVGQGDYDGDGVALDRKRTFSYFSSNQGTTGEFTVIVTNWELTVATMPQIIVRARSTIADGGLIEKYVRATTSRRSLFANGLVARHEITFSGNNVSVDSYNSEYGPYEPDLNVLNAKESIEDVNTDGIVNRFGNATVASASVETDAVDIGNSDVWGAVATGGDDPDVGPNGTIGDIGTTPGTIDADNVSTDFQANFPPPPDTPAADYTWSGLPTSDGAAWRVETTTSLSGVALSGGEKNYYVGIVGATTPVTIHVTSSISLGSKNKIYVQGPVNFVFDADFTGSGANTELAILPMPDLFYFDASGNPTSMKTDTAPLKIWAAGDFVLTGNGLTNPYAIPGSVQIYGTAPEPIPPSTDGTQDFDIKGNGDMSATVYAPNADLVIRGNGDINGSFVANTITASGMASFHYDEALGKEGTGKFSLALWRELTTAAQRTGYTW